MANSIMKLGLILSATDKMSMVLNNATSKFTKLDKVAKGFQKTGAVMFGAGSAVITAMGANFIAVADKAKELRLESQKIGMSIESFEKFSGYAKKTGIETDRFTASIAKMEKAEWGAAHGNKAQAAAFKMAGIEIFKSNGAVRKSEEMLSELSDRFNKTPDGVRKTALAMLIFGKSGKDMIPMLNKGSDVINAFGDELQRTGNILTGPQIAAFKHYTEQLAHTKTSITGLKTQIAVALLPKVLKLADKITDITTKVSGWIDKNKELFTSIVGWTGKIGIGLIALGSLNMVLGTGLRTIELVIRAHKIYGLVMAWTKTSFMLFKMQYYGMIAAQKLHVIWTGAVTAATWLFSAALWSTGIPEIVLAVVALGAGLYLLVKHWDVVTASMKKFGAYLLSGVLRPIIWVLDAIGKLTGAKWAINMAANLSAFKSKMDVTASTPIHSRAMSAVTSVSNSRMNTANSNQSQFVYSPVFHLKGGNDVKAEISTILGNDKRTLQQMLTDMNNRDKRLSYAR